MAAEGAFGGAGVAVGRDAGTGRPVDANLPGAYRTEGNPRCWGGGLEGFWRLGRSVIDRARQLGAQRPEHLVSDGNRDIAAVLELVYGREAPRQKCVFHLLRECRRNIGTAGYAAARLLLNSGSLSEGRECARRIMRATAGAARYWCEKALSKGLRHLATWQVAHGRRRAWSGAIGSCGGGRCWGWYGRNTTCWRCCQSRA